jgi:hypothetical protein
MQNGTALNHSKYKQYKGSATDTSIVFSLTKELNYTNMFSGPSKLNSHLNSTTTHYFLQPDHGLLHKFFFFFDKKLDL